MSRTPVTPFAIALDHLGRHAEEARLARTATSAATGNLIVLLGRGARRPVFEQATAKIEQCQRDELVAVAKLNAVATLVAEVAVLTGEVAWAREAIDTAYASAGHPAPTAPTGGT